MSVTPNILTLPTLRNDLAQIVFAMGDLITLIGRQDVAQQLVGFEMTGLYGELCEPGDFNLGTLEVSKAVERLHEACFAPSPGVRLHEDDDDILMLTGLLGIMPQQYVDGSSCLSEAKGRLMRLLSAAGGRCTLGDVTEDIESGRIDDEHRTFWALSVFELAALAQVDERSVRNMVSPSGTRPLRSLAAKSRGRRGESVYVDAFEGLGWLTGRRYYRPVPLDPAVFQGAVSAPKNARHLGYVIGLLLWSNVGDTRLAAKRLGWSVGELDGWIKHGPTKEAAKATGLANLTGLDADAFTAAALRLGR